MARLRQSRANETGLADVKAHLDVVQRANKKLQEELRTVRRDLCSAQAEAERVPSLEADLGEAREEASRQRSESNARRTQEKAKCACIIL